MVIHESMARRAVRNRYWLSLLPALQTLGSPGEVRLFAQFDGPGSPGVVASILPLFGTNTAFTAQAEVQILGLDQKERVGLPMTFTRLRLSSSWSGRTGSGTRLKAADESHQPRRHLAPLTGFTGGPLSVRRRTPSPGFRGNRAQSLAALLGPLGDEVPTPSNTMSLSPFAPRSLPASQLLRGL